MKDFVDGLGIRLEMTSVRIAQHTAKTDTEWKSCITGCRDYSPALMEHSLYMACFTCENRICLVGTCTK